MTSKICIFGAGAIGGYLAACLHDAGADVSLIARGQHLNAIKENGLKLEINGEIRSFKLNASDNPADFGRQDYVIIALKAHGISHITETIQPLLDPDTAVVSAVNGLPWWYFYKANTDTELDDKPLMSVDPEASIWNNIGPERAIGCVVYPACEISKPGTITHIDGNRISLGEPSGESTQRIKTLSDLMIRGGLKAPQKKRIRDEIWIKLWGNCSFNPVSALTGASLDKIAEDPDARKLVAEIMSECKQVGEALSIRFSVSIEDRINGAGRIIGHKPSTRQDIEMGRPLEIDPLVTALIEIAKQLQIDTPTLVSTSALLKLQARTLGLYQQ
jgi:2-dehydropantoate 2-reductase